jgi:hypothetical protein
LNVDEQSDAADSAQWPFWHQAWRTAMTFKFISLVALAVGGILAFSAAGSAQEVIFIVRHTDPPRY